MSTVGVVLYDRVMTDLSPNYHANAGHAKADMLTRDALRYLIAPIEEDDQKRDFQSLIEKGKGALSSVRDASGLLRQGRDARPDPILIKTLEDIDQFATDVLVRTQGSGIQAAQAELRHHISGALRGV